MNTPFKNHTKARGAFSLFTAAIFSIGLIGVAQGASAAEPDPDSARSVIENVAPEFTDGAAPTEFDTSTGAWTFTSGSTGVSVEVPAEPTNPITIADGELTIDVPSADVAQTAQSEGDGIVSYDNQDGSLTVPVVKSDGSVQIATIIGDASAPNRYSYELGTESTTSLQLQEDGSVIVLGSDGEWIAAVGAPWAIDANGQDVPTHYEVNGATLTQVVDLATTNIAYPVVADPTVSYCTLGGFYPAQCVKLSRAETKAAAVALGSGTAGSGAIAGHFCSKIPNVAARVACIGAVAATAFANIQNISAANNQGRCVQFAFTYPGIAQLLSGGFQVVNC